jgi:6-phosphofructokinase 1
MPRNALVAQSGGPSPVINASLAGVIDACRAHGDKIGTLYAAAHGIEGVLREELIDLNREDADELRLLRYTPASGAIGTCRYKLSDEDSPDFTRILDVLRAHDIGYFFYIGGNDSMDTAAKVGRMAKAVGYDLTVAGVPKTIDNDLGDEGFTIIDHTPGYGSTARYWAMLMQNADEENRAIYGSECVSVYQAMGRSVGFITAAARLGDPQRRMPLELAFSERGETLESVAERVNARLSRDGRCILVVNEGLDVGGADAVRDSFGHIEHGASPVTAMQATVNYLNSHRLNARGQATGQLPGVIQRGVSLYASTVDIDEAYRHGENAVEIALNEGTGFMSTILRRPGAEYAPYFAKVPLEIVANSERHLPAHWITPDGGDVTDEFVRYAMPLIGTENPPIPMERGLQRFARLKRVLIDKKLPEYILAGY